MNTLNIFAQHMRDLRLSSGMSLRQFAKVADIDASTISRMECGKAAPPKSAKILDKLAKALSLEKGTDEYDFFIDLACVESAARIFEDINDKKRYLPVFSSLFCRPTCTAHVERLIEKLKE
jgi:transcriptional regulator with XRE-family HTH domain